MAIRGNEIIEKSNRLNEVLTHGATLQEKRFLCIYLAKINARDLKTRKVCFTVADFQKIMDLGRMNIQSLQAVTNRLLTKVYNLPSKDGGYIGFTLFNRCRLFHEKRGGDWFIEIEASKDAWPLMFNLKNRYFSYELWNALRCKSANQITMYELLKQHEKQGSFEISVEKLRGILDVTEGYERWSNFKTRILDSCQKALAENTDIRFEYRRGKVGARGQWKTIIFDIFHNDNAQQPFCIIENFVPAVEPSDNNEEYEVFDFDGEEQKIPCDSDIPLLAGGEERPYIGNTEEQEDASPWMANDVVVPDNDDAIEEWEMLQKEMLENKRAAHSKAGFGFEDAIFDEFTTEQLIELRDLAFPNVSKDRIDYFTDSLHNPEAAVQWATAEYIRNKINMVRANRRVKYFYRYLKTAVSKNFE